MKMTEEGCFQKCKGCKENINTDCAIQIVNALWHPSCFRCSICSHQLSTWYIKKAGNLLCRKDYWDKYRHLCNGCSLLISGPVMVAGEHRYHPECFQCCQCNSCIGQDEPYVLVERSTLYCGLCYHVQVNSELQTVLTSSTKSPLSASSAPSSSSPTSTSLPSIILTVTPMTNTDLMAKPQRLPHTIQMIKLPPSVKEYHHHHKATTTTESTHFNKSNVYHKGESKRNGNNEEPKKLQDGTHNEHCGLRLTVRPNTESGDGGPWEGTYRHSFVLEGGRMAPCARIDQLDKSRDLQGLQVGDCVLEVNGSSMRDKSLEEICDVICNRSSSLSIVVERDPTPLPAPPPIQGKETVPSLPPQQEGTSIMIENTPVRLRNKGTLRARGHSPNRRRSKSPSPCPSSGRQKVVDLSRSRSFTSQNLDHRVFRPTDLVIGEILGQGFFGKAMKAKHKITGESMVLKELHNFDENAQKGFLTEVSMLRNLSHPCVLKFLGVLYRDKKLTLVTEFIDGGTLSDLLLDKSVELSWIHRLNLVKDIANGMAYLHSNDIIHRDLNSNNCFVRKDLSAIVGDFGLAKIFPRNKYLQMLPRKEEGKDGNNEKPCKRRNLSRRKRQTVVGNPYWMAPEMILSTGMYDEKVDIFSYGVIVFETIARVTADPDYMPRSIDLGVNVEAFHRRFCQQTPEPYTMLATLCSHIEPDKRPSFDEIQVLCEALHLHLEHGRSIPQELKKSTVEFYHATKERLYGKDYRDSDSVQEAEHDLEKKKAERLVLSLLQVDPKEDSHSDLESDFMSVFSEENVSAINSETVSLISITPSNPSESVDSSRTYYSDSSSVLSAQTMDLEQARLNHSFLTDTDSVKCSQEDLKSACSSCDVAAEDSTYFSSSSLSPFASVSSLNTDGFVTCKTSPASCCEGEVDCSHGKAFCDLYTCCDSNEEKYLVHNILAQTTNDDSSNQSELHSHLPEITSKLIYHQVVSLSSPSSHEPSQPFLSHSATEPRNNCINKTLQTNSDSIDTDSVDGPVTNTAYNKCEVSTSFEINYLSLTGNGKSDSVEPGQTQSPPSPDVSLTGISPSQSPIHRDSYMCSSRRRQKKVRDSLEQASSPPNSPQSPTIE